MRFTSAAVCDGTTSKKNFTLIYDGTNILGVVIDYIYLKVPKNSVVDLAYT
jgi:hypothetical protein